MRAWLVYVGLGGLFTHELDAMTNHEWRVLPLTSWLDDGVGELVFVLAHVPLFAVAIGFVASTVPRVRARAETVVAAFMVIHAGLHAAFSARPAYEFSGWLSNGLIFAAAACGLAYLVLRWTGLRTAA
ncbi:MAG: DUF6713 family protein [Gammaproteobacteria bacterium]